MSPAGDGAELGQEVVEPPLVDGDEGQLPGQVEPLTGLGAQPGHGRFGVGDAVGDVAGVPERELAAALGCSRMASTSSPICVWLITS
jgi:hypothetical protein